MADLGCLSRRGNSLGIDRELEGIPLKIYLALVNEGKPLGPREVMRLTGISSPSVAYRNLQKLESFGLVEKDAYGEYILKQKQSVKGYLWFGNKLLPRLVVYTCFFIGVLSVEAIIAVEKVIVGEPLQTDYLMLIVVTIISIAIFSMESILIRNIHKKKN